MSTRFFFMISVCLLLAAPLRMFAANTTEGNGLSIVQKPQTIRISEQGRIFVGDKETALRQLAKRLQQAGVAKTDTVYVSIPDQTPRKALVALSKELSSKGFRRVIFTKPPKASAETKPES